MTSSYETKTSKNYYGIVDSKAYQEVLGFQPNANSTFLNKISDGAGAGDVMSDLKKGQGLSDEDEIRYQKAMNDWFDEVRSRLRDHSLRVKQSVLSFSSWYSKNRKTFMVLDEIASRRKDANAAENKKRKSEEMTAALDKRDSFDAAIEEFKLACLSGDQDEISRTEQILRACGP